MPWVQPNPQPVSPACTANRSSLARTTSRASLLRIPRTCPAQRPAAASSPPAAICVHCSESLAELPFDLAQVGADVEGPRLLLDAGDEPGNAVREAAHVAKVPGFEPDVVEVDLDFSRGIGEEEAQLVDGGDVIDVDAQGLPARLQDNLFESGVVAEADPQVHGEELGGVECLEDQVPVRGPVPHRKLSLR